ncbi:MAG: phosphosulfolactate synthase [Nitrososphaerota archaeon]|nr:phosphosulfolactate synthase [Nitrososphaerota archaeon]
MILDRLSYGISETINLLGEYADTAKIGWGLPFLVDQKLLSRRVGSYRKNQIHVSNGGTLLEICVMRDKESVALNKLASSGFDTIELSEGVVEIPFLTKRRVAEFAHSHGLRLNVEVGRKNPRNQLGLEETIERISRSMDLDPDSIILEGRESGRSVGIYDDAGQIKWEWVDRIQKEFSATGKIMYEAPQEVQQTELILHIDSKVNLGNVAMSSLGALETQRLGLRGDTLGVTTDSKNVEGGPAARFVFYIIASSGLVDQSKIMNLTGMNRRTIQGALQKLLNHGVIRESPDLKDMRRKMYSLR